MHCASWAWHLVRRRWALRAGVALGAGLGAAGCGATPAAGEARVTTAAVVEVEAAAGEVAAEAAGEAAAEAPAAEVVVRARAARAAGAAEAAGTGVEVTLLAAEGELDPSEVLGSAVCDAHGEARVRLPREAQEQGRFLRLRASVGEVSEVRAIDPRDRELVVEVRVAQGEDGAARAIEVGAPGSASAALWAAEAIAEGWSAALPEHPRRARKKGDDAAAMGSRCEAAAAALAAAEPAVKAPLRAFYLRFAAQRCDLGAAAIAAELTALGAQEPLWGLDEELLMIPLGKWGGDPAAEAAREGFVDRVIAEHPNAELVGSLLLKRLFEAEDGPEEVAAAATLKSPRFAGTVAAMVAAALAPVHLNAGARVPAFSAVTTEGAVISSESLRGRPYVLDFWGTWCHPCIEAMPALHGAYAAVNLPGRSPPRGAAAWRRLRALPEATVPFISVAVNDDAEKVAAFRRGQWPMPWAQVVDVEGEGGIAAALAVRRFPLVLFVDAEGVIVQRDGDLRAGAARLAAARPGG